MRLVMKWKCRVSISLKDPQKSVNCLLSRTLYTRSGVVPRLPKGHNRCGFFVRMESSE